jgi:outer membrane protein assembly factor BamB
MPTGGSFRRLALIAALIGGAIGAAVRRGRREAGPAEPQAGAPADEWDGSPARRRAREELRTAAATLAASDRDAGAGAEGQGPERAAEEGAAAAAAGDPRWRARRISTLGLVAGVVLVVLAAAGIGVFGVLSGWFDSGDVTGSTEGFVEEPAAGAVDEERAAGAWAEYGYDRRRTRALTEARIAPPFRRVWSVDAGSLLEFPPVIAKGRLVVGTNAGVGLALDPQTGRELWRTRLRGGVASSPALFKDLAVFATLRGRVIVLNARTGRRIWSYDAGAPIESSPLVTDRSIYFGTLDGRVIRLSLDTRRPVWQARATNEVKGSLALAGRNVVVGDYGGRVIAYARRDGRVAWSTESPGTALQGAGRFYAGPAVSYGRVFIGNVNGRVLGLSARTGAVAWLQVLDDYVYSSAAVADRTVFVGSYDQRLHAIDAVTGRIRWSFHAGERISGSPSIVGRYVYFSTIARRPSEGRTIAVDRRTGEQVWGFPDGRYSPAVAVDGLLVITGVRTLYGFRQR